MLALIALLPWGSAATPATCTRPLHGTDWFNTDHQRTAHATSYAECCALCNLHADCKAFTYQTQQHSCYLKGSNGGQRHDPNCISGCKGGK